MINGCLHIYIYIYINYGDGLLLNSMYVVWLTNYVDVVESFIIMYAATVSHAMPCHGRCDPLEQ